MCIRWCCKHCLDGFTLLTHRWAYERCNEYFIARSGDETITTCPRGPWELRRAYHRHPYRGPQRCDHCKSASRKEKKLIQAARQKANMALGHRSSYNGAVDLGELEIPETVHGDSQPLPEPRKLDAMKAKWESFNVTHKHLPSHELEREWTKRFTSFKSVDLKAGLSCQTSEISSVVGLRINGKDGSQVITTIPERAARNPHQHIIRHPTSSKCERNETLFQSPRLFIPYKPTSIIKRPSTTYGASPFTDQHVLYNNTSPNPNTEMRNATTAEKVSSPTTRPYQLPYNIRSGMTTNKNYSSVTRDRLSRDSDHREVKCNSTSTTCLSSSQPTRTRPWDL